jgi:hypothetical protein
LCLLLLLLGGLTAPARADHGLPRHRILLINSYPPGYAWSDGIEDGLRGELARESHSYDLAIEYLDTKHFDSSQLFPELEKYFLAKYRHHQPNVLITADDAALEFVLSRRETLFPDIP